MHERKCYADTTDFPELYKQQYWGNFQWDENNCPDSKIIKNRNKLAKEYKLISKLDSDDIDCRSNTGEAIWHFAVNCTVDHNEIYLAQNKIYIIQSFHHSFGSLYARHNDMIEESRSGPYLFQTFSQVKKSKEIKFPKADDWKQIYPIYALDQKTYILDITEYLKPFLKKTTRKVLQGVV
jgi:hypothetical protein